VTLRSDLQPTSECVPLDRLGSELTAAERIHVDGCARCQAEFAIWESFNEPSRDDDERETVAWIVARLQHARGVARAADAAAAARKDRAPRFRGLLGLAAAVMVAAALGYVAWDREPAVAPQAGQQAYRTASIDIVSPSGDIPSPPGQLVWVASSAAARYDVRVLEVDGTVVWRSASLSPRVDLPGGVVARIVPGKTLMWEVTALDGSGRVIAQSGARRFRLPITPPSGNGR
jgi:hypothetical protein